MTVTTARHIGTSAPVMPRSGRLWLETIAPHDLSALWQDSPHTPYLLRLNGTFHLVTVPVPVGLRAMSLLTDTTFGAGAVALDERAGRIGFLVYPSGRSNFVAKVRSCSGSTELPLRYCGTGTWFLVPGPRPHPNDVTVVRWLRPPRHEDDFTLTVDLARCLVAAATPADALGGSRL